MNEIFNNREIATGIWLLIAVFMVARNKGVRESCMKLLECFFKWKILVQVLLMAAYSGLSVVFLYWLGLWNLSLLKDTIYWFLFSGFMLLMSLMTGRENAKFFRKTIIDCFKAMVLVQFLINFYALPLVVELLLVPVIGFLVLEAAYTENKPQYSLVKKVCDGGLSIIGLGVLAYLGVSIHRHYAGIVKWDVLRSLLLPIWLTILFLPFLYLAKLIADYEKLFVRLPYFVKRGDDRLLAYVKRRVVMLCHFDLRRLSRFSKNHLASLHSIEDTGGADQLFKNFQLGVACDADKSK